MPLLSIVVPTRDRIATALPCIRHLLTMPGNDFEVVVSDCGASRELGDAISAIGDVRLVYAPFAPCSMTENFNNGVRHCSGDYVSLIGDDDMFLQAGLDTVRRLAPSGVDAIVSPYRAGYYWDGFPDVALAGKLTLTDLDVDTSGHRSIGWAPDRTVRSRSALVDLLRSGDSLPLPVVYHGVIARRHLDAVAARTGAVFKTQAPDTYLTGALCTLMDEYVIVDRPLTLFGKSQQSNSARLLVKDGLTKHRDEFVGSARELDALVPPVDTVETYVTDSWIRAFRDMGDTDLLDIFIRGYLARSYSDSLRRNPRQVIGTLRHLLVTARRNDPRVASMKFAKSLVGYTAKRVAARLGDRVRAPRSTITERIDVPSFEIAIALVESRVK